MNYLHTLTYKIRYLVEIKFAPQSYHDFYDKVIPKELENWLLPMLNKEFNNRVRMDCEITNTCRFVVRSRNTKIKLSGTQKTLYLSLTKLIDV